MDRTHLALAAALAAFTSGCASVDQGASGAASAAAEIRDASGTVVARVTARDRGSDVHLRVEAVAMKSGIYGAHIHAVGRCDAPDFASAGPHWNPTMRQHGRDNPQGMHKGDLLNLTVGADGHGIMEATVPSASLRSGATPVLDGDGAAVVIHASSDDYRTDPSGNSGARIACGVLG